jgi:hypothetical protein
VIARTLPCGIRPHGWKVATAATLVAERRSGVRRRDASRRFAAFNRKRVLDAAAASTNARMEGATHARQTSIIRPAPRMPPTAALRSGRSKVSQLANGRAR